MIYYTILYVIYIILQTYGFLMGATIILSWIPAVHDLKIYRLARYISSWYLGYFSDIILLGPFDFTPMIGLGIYHYVLSLIWI